MASLRAATSVLAGSRANVKTCVSLPKRRAVRVVAHANESSDMGFQVGKVVSLMAVSSQWMLSGNAQAAAELSQIAASDNRVSSIVLLLVPALGWVAYNILQPLFNQLGRMDEIRGVPQKKTVKRGVAAVIGMGAALTLLSANSADASTELAQVADGRANIIFALFVPALGWVAFNILQPLFNQLGRMDEIRGVPVKKTSKRGLAAAIGAGAALSLLSASSASASSELAQLAESDLRANIIFTLFIPALGWVAFNILQPLFNQLGRMDEMRGAPPKKTKAKGKK